MVALSEQVISKIKDANTEKELREVINGSLSLFEKKNAYNIGIYIMNMIVSLQAIKAEQLPAESMKNIIIAIDIFREHRKQNPERAF